MSENKIVKGSFVKFKGLKSPVMKVVSITTNPEYGLDTDSDGDSFECVWFTDDGMFQNQTFDEWVLILTDVPFIEKL